MTDPSNNPVACSSSLTLSPSVDEYLMRLETVALSQKGIPLSEAARLFMTGGGASGSDRLGGPSDPFKQSLWVNACITAIATAGSGVPIRLSVGQASGTRGVFNHRYVRKGRHKARCVLPASKGLHKAAPGDIVETGDLFQLLARPNDGQSWSQLMLQTLGLLYCHGRVHWLFDEMIGRRPATIYCIPGNRTTPLVARTGRVRPLVGWKLRMPEGGEDILTLDECVSFQLFNPDDPNAGLAPRNPASLAIVSDYNASLYNAAMFGNNCEPGSVLATDAEFNPELDQQMRTSWQQRHRGPANARSLAILWGGLNYQSMTSTMKEMLFPEGKQLAREEICAAYRVPPTVAGFFGTTGDSSAYTNNELKRFWQDTMMPLLDQIGEGINLHICPRFPGNLEAFFDLEDVPVIQEMRLTRIDAVRPLWPMGVAFEDLNEWADLGLPERPQHAVSYVSVSMVPTDQAGMGGTLPPLDEPSGSEPGSGSDQEPADSIQDAAAPGDRKQTDNTASTADRRAVATASMDRIWELWQRSWAPLAKRCGAMLSNHFAAQQRKLIKLLKDSGQEPVRAAGEKVGESTILRILLDVFEDRDGKLKFRGRMQRQVKDATELGVSQAAGEAGLEAQARRDFVRHQMADPAINAAMQSETIRLSSLINDRTRAILRKNLTDGAAAGETPLQLADRVQEIMGNRRTDAVRIARNSVGQALSGARHRAIGRTRMTHEIWVHSRGPGERRESHIAAEQQYAAHPKHIGEPFVIGGAFLRYPRDPSGPPGEIVNCQCLAIAKRLTDRDGRSAAGAEGESILATALTRGFVSYDQMLAERGSGSDQGSEQGTDRDNAQTNERASVDHG